VTSFLKLVGFHAHFKNRVTLKAISFFKLKIWCFSHHISLQRLTGF